MVLAEFVSPVDSAVESPAVVTLCLFVDGEGVAAEDGDLADGDLAGRVVFTELPLARVCIAQCCTVD